MSIEGRAQACRLAEAACMREAGRTERPSLRAPGLRLTATAPPPPPAAVAGWSGRSRGPRGLWRHWQTPSLTRWDTSSERVGPWGLHGSGGAGEWCCGGCCGGSGGLGECQSCFGEQGEVLPSRGVGSRAESRWAGASSAPQPAQARGSRAPWPCVLTNTWTATWLAHSCRSGGRPLFVCTRPGERVRCGCCALCGAWGRCVGTLCAAHPISKVEGGPGVR